MELFYIIIVGLLVLTYLWGAAETHFKLLGLKETVNAEIANARSSIQVESDTLRDLEKAARDAVNHEKGVHIRTNGQWSRSARQQNRKGAGINLSHQQNNFAQLHAPQVLGEIGRLIGPQRQQVDRSIEKANEAVRQFNTLRLSFWYLPFREFMKPMSNVTPRQLAGGQHGRKSLTKPNQANNPHSHQNHKRRRR